MRGNVVDLAVGVIIGAAFGKIVTSFVNDLVMPPLGLAIGGVNFKDLKTVLKPATTDAAGKAVDAVALNYGAFLQTVFDFMIVAFAIFAMVQLMNRLMRKRAVEAAEPAPPPAPTAQEVILAEIRDELRARRT